MLSLIPSPLGLINPCVAVQEEASGGGGHDRVRNLQSEVEGVKNIMTQNVERILARGENLDHLRNKTEDLEATVRWGAHWGQEEEREGESLEIGGWGWGTLNKREVCLLTCFRN